MSNREDTCEELETGRLTELARVRARAEARETEGMIRYRDAELDRIARLERPLQRQIERAAISLDIGQAMGLSEAQVYGRLASADRVREHTPQVWLAFRDGRINEARVREISSTVDVLQREDSHIRLDQQVVAYAQSHTVAELRRWLRRFVQRVETDLALERAERAREDRRVDVRHGDDGMASLFALLPAPQAAAIAKRLAAEAKALGADDPRTLAQRQADLLAAWMTTNETGEASIHAQIAVKLSAETFTGANDGFAEAADGSWSCPAGWVLDPDLISNPVWHRLIVDPITDDVLAHQYVGRLAPDTLKSAMLFRDGVCQAPGCLVPADQCDGDHREPWPDGPTSGENMWPLCRRHHILKGHQVLRWILPSGQMIDAEPAHRQPPSPPPSAMEHRLAHLLVQH
jgi:hypothetical protein